jgi:carbamoyl-phosphate synthase large subunit
MARSVGLGVDSQSAPCANADELAERCAKALVADGAVQIEEWLGGWKEVEFEILRDPMDNCVAVTSLENVDPLGVHTGDSITVAPCQTIDEALAQELRAEAIRIARHFNVIGEANVRFAIDPASASWRVVEVSARISRSTILASKATGFPLPFVSARVALGYSLSEIPNRLTGSTRYSAEPGLDYVAVKMPRWDLGKFKSVDRHIGPEMKSVGVAMAFGRSFEAAIQQAARMAEAGAPGIACNPFSFRDLKDALKNPTDLRIFAAYNALKEGWSNDRVYKYARIDRWFIDRLRSIWRSSLRSRGPVPCRRATYYAARRGPGSLTSRSRSASSHGKKRCARFARRRASFPWSSKSTRSRGIRLEKQPALPNLRRTTDDVTPSGRGAMILGSGPYHIGSSIEYDWCCASALSTARQLAGTRSC